MKKKIIANSFNCKNFFYKISLKFLGFFIDIKILFHIINDKELKIFIKTNYFLKNI